ncbi:hypothetical protein BVH01_09670 [Pseudomonas sp. PA1(2017)]|uniref:hypothetical protein n=1 Tax=Pseudomonas sp. PA1(2017) TaxID=1932113 RepID=UPI000967E2C4|nr:hypothetical protein [Pseudomonas sp. PA1(2017)]OLU16832.1 hypothetical protein BVH01_09670 [Pseudomonas sp. PA1(2017)]
MAKSATRRKQEQRERDKLAEEERLARLLSCTIKLDLFKATDAQLIRSMERLDIEEPQDLISRLICGANCFDDETLLEITDM